MHAQNIFINFLSFPLQDASHSNFNMFLERLIFKICEYLKG